MKQVCDVLGVARSNVSAKLVRAPGWQDRRGAVRTDDTALVAEIQHAVKDLPSYGYRRVWGMIRSERERCGAAPLNVKRVYRVMRIHALLLQRKPTRPSITRRHDGRVAVGKSNQRWCSDGFEFRCENGEPLRVTFALDCCDREATRWVATTGGYTGNDVRDVMLAAIENRFGNVDAAPSSIE